MEIWEAVQYYSGWEHAMLVKGIAPKTKELEEKSKKQQALLQSFAIQASAFDRSITESNRKLKEATNNLSVILQKLSLFTQWIVFRLLFNIPELEKSIEKNIQLVNSAVQKENDFSLYAEIPGRYKEIIPIILWNPEHQSDKSDESEVLSFKELYIRDTKVMSFRMNGETPLILITKLEDIDESGKLAQKIGELILEMLYADSHFSCLNIRLEESCGKKYEDIFKSLGFEKKENDEKLLKLTQSDIEKERVTSYIKDKSNVPFLSQLAVPAASSVH